MHGTPTDGHHRDAVGATAVMIGSVPAATRDSVDYPVWISASCIGGDNSAGVLAGPNSIGMGTGRPDELLELACSLALGPSEIHQVDHHVALGVLHVISEPIQLPTV